MPPTIHFESPEAFEAWLAEHHEDEDGLWLKVAKKGSGIPTVTHAQALELALCHGWIDGQRKALDERYFLQRFTPRRARSRWSKINREKAEELTVSGRMHEAGLREIERAKADGRWEAAYASQANITVPDDLQAELDADPKARAFFDSLSSQNRYAILYRLHDAKRPETRQRRLAKFVGMLKNGETLHP
jgi:uncharacterized protein YdeI (YjbR/CyaY-like superfamily)